MKFQKATAKQAAVKIGIYGPPGSGKTCTALLFAESLVQGTGKRIAFVDTERGSDFYTLPIESRAFHPEAFDFDAIYTRSIAEVSQAIANLDDDYGVVVIDSMTHLWDTLVESYRGKRAANGSIPFHAWPSIKKPWRKLMDVLISSDFHVIFCVRQANVFEDVNGEMKVTGFRPRAEGESAHEPHIMIRMFADLDGNHAVIEKDRTGILSGQIITYPDGANLAPVVDLLAGKQGRLPNDDDAVAANVRISEQEAEAMTRIILKSIADCQTKDRLRKEIFPQIEKVKDDLSESQMDLIRLSCKAALNDPKLKD